MQHVIKGHQIVVYGCNLLLKQEYKIIHRKNGNSVIKKLKTAKNIHPNKINLGIPFAVTLY